MTRPVRETANRPDGRPTLTPADTIMKARACALPMFVVLLTAHAVAVAQPPFGGPFGGGNNLVQLLRNESVQKELKLATDQTAKLEALEEKMRESFGEIFSLDEPERGKKMQALMQENEKAIAGFLKPEQVKRLKQISLQRQGPMAWSNPEVADALKLTKEQAQQLQKINQELQAKMRDVLEGGGPPDDETRGKIEKLQNTANEQRLKLLSD